MKMPEWRVCMTDKETAEMAYWERNMLALRYADGWYYDDVISMVDAVYKRRARFKGWRRVLSLDGGRMTFHVPDCFDVGDLPSIRKNWDGHTTKEKWARVARLRGIKAE